MAKPLRTEAASPPSTLGQLVEAAYDATIKPERYDALLASWDAFLRDRAGRSASDPDDPLEPIGRGEHPDADAVAAHFSRAMDIFERLGRARRAEASAQEMVDALPGWGALVDRRGRVRALNGAARALSAPAIASAARAAPRPSDDASVQAAGPARLEHLALEPAATDRALAWIRGRAPGASADVLVTPCDLGDPPRRSCLIAAPIDPPASLAGAADDPAAAGPLFLLATLDLQLDAEAADAFARAFELSDAEVDVAAALAKGDRPADIAEKRGASLNTVRSQIKAATKKIGATGAADVARILSGFAASFVTARAVRRRAARHLPPHGLRREGAIILPSGRRLGYVEQGAQRGQPVLFLHSFCFGPHWTDAAVETAARRNLRLIGPWRAGFGDSDPNPQPDTEATLDAAAADARHLLDRLEIEDALLVTHQTASVFGLRLATTAPGRVRGMLSIGHLPIWRDEFFAVLPPRMRLLARTARYAPHLLPFLMRAAVALIDAGEETRLGQLFFAESPRDLTAIARSEIFAPMAEGLVGSARQGPMAFCKETQIALENFAGELGRVEAPIRVLHGALDPSFPPSSFEGAEALAPRLERQEIADAASTLLYTHWPTVIDTLIRLDAETA